MWIFFNDAMLSIVAHPAKPNTLVVRARAKGDIERVFPGSKVTRTPQRDYLYRTEVERWAVAEAISDRAHDNTATNFKDSVAENDRHDAYAEVWRVMFRFQQARDSKPANRAPAMTARKAPRSTTKETA